MNKPGGEFLKIFKKAVKELPDTQVFVNWMIYTLGVMAYRAEEEELWLAEREIYKMKPEVRH